MLESYHCSEKSEHFYTAGQKIGIIEISLLCSPMLHLFDQTNFYFILFIYIINNCYYLLLMRIIFNY